MNYLNKMKMFVANLFNEIEMLGVNSFINV
jgi:hypothetical protein